MAVKNETADKAVLPQTNKIKLRPQSKFVKMPGAPKNMGWLKAWQDKQEHNAGKRIN